MGGCVCTFWIEVKLLCHVSLAEATDCRFSFFCFSWCRFFAFHDYLAGTSFLLKMHVNCPNTNARSHRFVDFNTFAGNVQHTLLQGDTAYHWDCVQRSYQWYGISSLARWTCLQFPSDVWNCWTSCYTALFLSALHSDFRTRWEAGCNVEKMDAIRLHPVTYSWRSEINWGRGFAFNFQFIWGFQSVLSLGRLFISRLWISSSFFNFHFFFFLNFNLSFHRAFILRWRLH